tara:strand:+ start:2712 stop:3479 length:768 start_codon:yes stop_codon:yes gene_type:complete
MNKIQNLSAVILCGGRGSRLGSLTKIRPKPMINIKGQPLIWHIIKIYYKFGIKNFYLALGYKSFFIKNYFRKLENKKKNKITILLSKKKNRLENDQININLINTGHGTLTGGRLLRLKKYFRKNENFFLTYGDGISDINLTKLYKKHILSNKIATVTAVKPPARFGAIKFYRKKIVNFQEKIQTDNGWINGGFFVCNYKIFDYIKNDNSILEQYTLPFLVKKNQLTAYKHNGFWQCVDTIRDKEILEEKLKKNEL